ncbi:MAG: phosphotransferase family protein [Deltaproteobacteria bacterium]|nr:phosphotransferase family protein [Deltaproteobacteria bacterium]
MAETLHLDASRAVRPGEELDLPALTAHLQAHLDGLAGPLVVEQFPSGHSNLTYLLRAGDRELVLRRPPFGTRVKTAHDMGREHRILAGLCRVYPKAPRPLLYCADPAVIGAPFYLMERVRGVILRGRQPKAAAGLAPAAVRRLCEALVDGLAELHAVDVAAAGLADVGHPEGYVRRQVEGWTRRYFDAKTDEVPALEAAAAWLPCHLPPESGAAIIHNDYKYYNVVLDPDDLTRVVAVLDWEMASVGDPLMDLGTSLGYWVDPDDSPEHRMLPFGPTTLPGNLTRAEVVVRYTERSGRDVRGVLFYYVFALLKVATIAQQIYQRFVEGHTKDPRFAAMIFGVRILGATAARALELGRIDRLG